MTTRRTSGRSHYAHAPGESSASPGGTADECLPNQLIAKTAPLLYNRRMQQAQVVWTQKDPYSDNQHHRIVAINQERRIGKKREGDHARLDYYPAIVGLFVYEVGIPSATGEISWRATQIGEGGKFLLDMLCRSSLDLPDWFAREPIFLDDAAADG